MTECKTCTQNSKNMATKKAKFNDIIINEDLVPPENLEALLEFLTKNTKITGRVAVIQTLSGLNVSLLLKAVDPEEQPVETALFLGKY